MADDAPQARAFDLPGWPCPPRVADIPECKDSYGWIAAGSVAVDDEGRLWVDGLAHPRPRPQGDRSTLVAWCEDGIALRIPVESIVI
ncbi:hypothetical protein [Nonomuraea sp. bgisy101]|uniref:hypothetical protein n=1 Tax=Nonomuraea sp. bgisy101 TaxID=3413784 RepID=UPI003D762C6E